MTAAAWCTARWQQWRARGQRGEHPCDRRPIFSPCTAPLPGGRLTLAAVEEHAQAVQRAFEGLP